MQDGKTQEKELRGGWARDGNHQVVSLPKGMTGELMRKVASIDVTRMSCQEVIVSGGKVGILIASVKLAQNSGTLK